MINLSGWSLDSLIVKSSGLDRYVLCLISLYGFIKGSEFNSDYLISVFTLLNLHIFKYTDPQGPGQDGFNPSGHGTKEW